VAATHYTTLIKASNDVWMWCRLIRLVCVMKIEKVSIKGLFVSTLLILSIAAIGLSILSATYFRNAALESQKTTLSRIVDISAKESLDKLRQLATEMGVAAQTDLSAPLKKVGRSSKDLEAKALIVATLDDQFHQRYVTAGMIDVKKLRVYNKKFALVAQSKEGVSGLPDNMTSVLFQQAKDRKGPDRLKAISGL